MINELIINTILLVLAVPVGFLIAWLCRDELIDGKKWFSLLITLGVFGAIGFYLYEQSATALTCGFIAIVSFISLLKSRDKKWTKKKV
jgi:EamA domain-containing membrane protein RarD